ncbi:hypothetical protein [Cupriavidus basilensis]|uniref:hypothetical protein n=1 Tax=Cupriavidus basilensis TaxID=68895 RepID=UPI0039F66AF2
MERIPILRMGRLPFRALQTDGPLNAGQVHQVTTVRHSAEALSQLVDDLLDLAMIASGKTDVDVTEFTLDSTFRYATSLSSP